ncbi:hypothetical protein PVK06_002787 [Gossypium arboreum]|uniref:Endoglucanase n=1 Tax=Gossypium arboreum TaxID=29729 RepID=A0ABR0R5L6_GOSAR|nr:hypothetical protein PVK06_002787 [Gossypium arboreum]
MGSGKCMTLLTLLAVLGMVIVDKVGSQNYGDALSKCILFFEGQRTGKLPSNQRMIWRKDSALRDGSDLGMDLLGGYYDAGDNVKFNFPMAFSTTMLAWSVIEFGQFMGPDLQHAQDSIRWGADYLLKSTDLPGKVTAAVGNPIADHNCWERPEDMDTPRTSYVVNQTHPGSEVSAETAAALAASSLVFKSAHHRYSILLVNRAKEVFEFADKFRGNYKDSVGQGVCPFYCDWGSYSYMVQNNIPNLPRRVIRLVNGDLQAAKSFAEFGWDTKDAEFGFGCALQLVMNSTSAEPYVPQADRFVCSVLPESPYKSVTYSPALSRFEQIAKGQVDYILGKNPLGMSYMVGFSQKFPKRIHHRASSLPSIGAHPRHINCKDGSPYYETLKPNPNLLTGAIIGGPDMKDQFPDNRTNAGESEPTTYINAPLVGILAYFKTFP